MSPDQFVVEGSISGCKKQLLELRPSNSRRFRAGKSSENHESVGRKAEIKRLEGRLRVLEEEGGMLKRDLSETLEERTKLISEISGYFESILQHCLLKREEDRRDFDTNGVQITSFKEDGRAGLLQVLCQESNPTLVNRAFRADALAYDL